MRVKYSAFINVGFFAGLFFGAIVETNASPLYSRQYELSCAACHSVPPLLNELGLRFAETDRLDHWKDATTVDTGDDQVSILKTFPLAMRSELLVRGRQGTEITDRSTEIATAGAAAKLDFQAPYQIKLISSAPLAEKIGYFLDVVFAPAGANGGVNVQNAWMRYGHESYFRFVLGQFNLADLLISPNQRLTAQDFSLYTAAGLDYDRGARIELEARALTLTLGAQNGTGSTTSYSQNGPGIARNERLFDNDTTKSLFAILSIKSDFGRMGGFYLLGEQPGASGAYGEERHGINTASYTTGIHFDYGHSGQVHWFAQATASQWDNFLYDGQPRRWFGGFIGADYLTSDRFVISMLYQHTDAGDFKNSGTVYEGLARQSFTATSSYYFKRNLRGLLEISMDLLPIASESSKVGHLNKDSAIAAGFDLSF